MAGYGKRVRKTKGGPTPAKTKRGLGTSGNAKVTSRGTGTGAKKGGVRKMKFDPKKFNKARAQVFGLSEDTGKR